MYEVEIDRNNCKGCGACTKTSQLLFLDETNLVNMQGGFIEDGIVEGLVKSLYEIETPASICPKDCFTVYDENSGEEIEIERHATI
ncbi:ferredoxin [Methanosphaera sp. ISO3-F5]|uniref:ferredoxin n=1 Tax=Methanosphaera sp. ISO3-F5 TaxID=1452353 RepID=UPI002B258A5A|nr:ferredoxin [Methanosphaera sp. ISO3-F5]WQH65074.1 ferredoxin [Methanosphaera sp. ISO3-F5]